jgi:hypothetical protein
MTLSEMQSEKAKLYVQAMRAYTGSPKQERIIQQIKDIEEKIKMHYFQDGFNEESHHVEAPKRRTPNKRVHGVVRAINEELNRDVNYDPIDSYHDREEFAFGEPKSVFTPKTSFSIKDLSEDEIKDLVNELAPSDLVHCLTYKSLLMFTDELKTLVSERIKKLASLKTRSTRRR